MQVDEDIVDDVGDHRNIDKRTPRLKRIKNKSLNTVLNELLYKLRYSEMSYSRAQIHYR